MGRRLRIGAPAGGGATGNATISWTAPTQRTDNSALTNLAGFRVYYGTSAGNLDQYRDYDATKTSVTIGPLAVGTWYFAVKAFDWEGIESLISDTISKVVS